MTNDSPKIITTAEQAIEAAALIAESEQIMEASDFPVCKEIARKIRAMSERIAPDREAISRTAILREWFGGGRYARDWEYLNANFSRQADAILKLINRDAITPATAPEPDPICEYCHGSGSCESGGDEAHTRFSVPCICTDPSPTMRATEGLPLRRAINTVLAGLLAPVMPDLVQRVLVGNQACDAIIAAFNAEKPTAGEIKLLREALTIYGDHVRMAMAAMPEHQQVIDDAFAACPPEVWSGRTLDPPQAMSIETIRRVLSGTDPDTMPEDWRIRWKASGLVARWASMTEDEAEYYSGYHLRNQCRQLMEGRPATFRPKYGRRERERAAMTLGETISRLNGKEHKITLGDIVDAIASELGMEAVS